MAIIAGRRRISAGLTVSPTVQVVGTNEVRFAFILDQADADDPTFEFDVGINRADDTPHMRAHIVSGSGRTALPFSVKTDALDGQSVYCWIDTPRSIFVAVDRG